MATFKATVRGERKDGFYPMYIRVSIMITSSELTRILLLPYFIFEQRAVSQ